MAECNGCEYAARIESLEKSLDRNSEQHEKIYNRLNFLEKQNGVTDYQFSQIIKTLDELKQEVSEIKDKPSKRWDTVITVSITATLSCLVGAIITFLLQNI